MALIQKTRKGRKDGGYTRLFNNEELGSLISQVHATSIRTGKDLESVINLKAHAYIMTEEELNLFINKSLKENIKSKFIITKKLVKKLTKFIECGKEPDYCILIILDKKCFIIELKDGDTFDTKKVAGEILSLKEFARCFKNKFPEFEVMPKFCSFNLNDKAKIIYGVKGKISQDEAMTGQEFCDLLEISYQTIIEQRKLEAPMNLEYFLNELIQIEEVKQILDKIFSKKA